MSTIKFMKLTNTAKTPFKSTKYSAGYDLSADINAPILIKPHTTVKIGTGVAIETPEGYFAAVYARSGIATKEGLRPANCCGIIDSDYRNEIIVALHNDSDETRLVEPGQRIAQLVFQQYLNKELEEVTSRSDTERGLNGFGSSGKF